MRFWCLWSARAEFSQDEYWMPELYGRESTFLFFPSKHPAKLGHACSPSVSKANHRISWAAIPSLPMSGHSVFPSSSSQLDITLTHQKRIPTSLLNYKLSCMETRRHYLMDIVKKQMTSLRGVCIKMRGRDRHMRNCW